jgi:hypothetical protein
MGGYGEGEGQGVPLSADLGLHGLALSAKRFTIEGSRTARGSFCFLFGSDLSEGSVRCWISILFEHN